MSSAPNGAPPADPTAAVPASEPKPARNLRPLRMIWRETAKYPRQVIASLLALTVTASATLAIPAGFRMVVDRGFGVGGDLEMIGRWFRYLLLIVTVLGIGTAFRFYFVSWLGERVIADIRLKVQNNLLRLSPAFFEENSPNEISSRMTSDTALIEQVVGTTVSVALRNLIMGIGGVAILFSLAPMLTAGLLLGIVSVMVPLLAFGRRISTISRTSQDRVADIGAMVSETLGAMKIVQAFNQEAREQERFAASVELSFATAKRRIVMRAIISALAIIAIFGAIVLLVWQGAIEVAAGTITSGTIVQIVFVAAIVAGSLGALSEVYGDLLRGAGAASRLAELLDEKPQIAAPPRPLALPEPARGKISFEKVSFRYPTRLDVSALSDFSLTVEPGETVAIVGPSGAGKSTLFQLAERFYDPQSGTIKLDGVPITAVDPAEVRRRMAFVPQEAQLFAASARDNLRYGNWLASDEDIWEAAEAANAAKFLRDLPEGLDTYLGEGGARLSGGQRQRMAIARAVLRKAPILLLDEATSALDAESELLVQQALDRLMQDCTTLVIAHRLATVRGADRIVVLDAGKIVETGTHDQLTKTKGLYARLASLQFDERAFAEQEKR